MTTPPEAEPGLLVEVTMDLVYHQGDDRFRNAEGLVDVVAPTTDGPWPVVVAFHIHDLTKSSMRALATDIAAQERVVFVPDWGHPDRLWTSKNTMKARYDLYTQEVKCAVSFARSHAADYGGDPDHITVFGRFFGGNAALMAGLASPSPLDACAETGPGVVPQAVVSWDAAPLLGAPDWDAPLAEEPEAFYAFTPWRHLDSSQRIPIYIVTAEDSASYQQPFVADPGSSFLPNRHVDIDLVAELVEMGALDDGVYSLREESEWAHQTLLGAGYDAELVLLPGSISGAFEGLSDEIRGLVVDIVVHAGRE